jgi:threonine aldolase
MFCLSKGLSAPVGSMLAGSRDFIADARRIRKLLGGGMRQAGIIAAAGLLALGEMVGRLDEDHANTRRLALGLAEIPGMRVSPETVESNILFFDALDENGQPQNATFIHAAASMGALFSSGDRGGIRAVTHYGVCEEDIDRTLAICRSVTASRG